MINATCLEKIRGKHNEILEYKIVTRNKVYFIKPYVLKGLIKNKQIVVDNLTLTSDNRLIDTQKRIQSKNTKTKSKISLDDVAKAMVFIDRDILGMGDSYPNVVGDVLLMAGIDNIDVWEYSDDDSKLEKIHTQAYKKILDNKKNIGEFFTWFVGLHKDENEETILENIVYHGKTRSTNKVIKVLEILDTFGKMLLDNKLITEDSYDNIHSIKEASDEIDVELCSFAYDVANTFFRFLDEKYYFKSNDSYTIGGIQLEGYDEQKVGQYVLRASYNSLELPNNISHAVGFNREHKKIRLGIYKIVKDFNRTKLTYESNALLDTDKLDVTYVGKLIANKLNKLAIENLRSSNNT